MAKGDRGQANGGADDPAVECSELLPAFADSYEGAAGHVGAGQADDAENTAQEFERGRHGVDFYDVTPLLR